MVSTAALIAALQGQFAAARQGQGGGRSAGLPGLLASGNGEGGVNALSSGGIAGGGVPTTATTGSSIANSLLGGGTGGSDPLSQQVAQTAAFRLFSNGSEPNQPSDASLGEFDDLQGGDRDVLLSILSGNPALMAAAIGMAVNQQNFTFGDNRATGTASQVGGVVGGGNTQPPGFSVNQTSSPLSSAQAAALAATIGFGGGGDSTPGASGGGGGFVDPSDRGSIGGGLTI